MPIVMPPIVAVAGRRDEIKPESLGGKNRSCWSQIEAEARRVVAELFLREHPRYGKDGSERG
jgi:hypothetical protein